MSADDAEHAEPGHIEPLTALRFLAAIWVVLFHYWPHLDGIGTPGFVQKGYLGVELFFVLSGFILSHVYLRQAERGGLRYGAFLWARLARIYPLHLAVLAGVGLMGLAAAVMGVSVDPNLTDLRALPAHLTLTHAWGLSPVAGWNHPSWSISAEWFAYLLFPLFAWVALRLRDRPWVAAAAAAALMAVLYLGFERIAGQPLTRATIAWGALRIVPCFALGCAAYLLFRSGKVLVDRRAALTIAAATGALILGLAQLEAWDGLLALSFGGLILSLACAWRGGSRVMSRPTWVWLGEVSFAVYMVCIPWQQVYVNGVARLANVSEVLPWPLWVGLLCGVVPVAAIAHHCVEKPARSLMRRWWQARHSRAGQGMRRVTAF